MSDPAHSDEHLDVGARLRMAIVKLSRQLNASAEHAGLTPTQASVLGIIAFRGQVSLSQLSAIEAINPTLLSRVVSRLDELGLARRVPGENDLRTAHLEITPLGAETNERIRTERARTVAESVALLEPQQRDAIVAALPGLEALAEELIAKRSPR